MIRKNGELSDPFFKFAQYKWHHMGIFNFVVDLLTF